MTEKIAAAIANDKKKDNLGMVNIDRTRELLMDAGAILLDVRPPAKVEGENAEEAGIADAYYTPYTEFSEYLDILPEDKTTPIVVGCLKGWFANRVMGYLNIMGYENVYVMSENIVSLIEAHHTHAK